jgi:hypothetical protein
MTDSQVIAVLRRAKFKLFGGGRRTFVPEVIIPHAIIRWPKGIGRD